MRSHVDPVSPISVIQKGFLFFCLVGVFFFLISPQPVSAADPNTTPQVIQLIDTMTYHGVSGFGVGPVYKQFALTMDIPAGGKVILSTTPEGSGEVSRIGHGLHITFDLEYDMRYYRWASGTYDFGGPPLMGYDCYTHEITTPQELSSRPPSRGENPFWLPGALYRVTVAYTINCDNQAFFYDPLYLIYYPPGYVAPTPTLTPTQIPTETPTPTETPEPTGTETPTPTVTATPSPEYTLTPTPISFSIVNSSLSITPTPSFIVNSPFLISLTPTPSVLPGSGQATPTLIVNSPTPTISPSGGQGSSLPSPTKALSTRDSRPGEGDVLGVSTLTLVTVPACIREEPIMQEIDLPESYTDYVWDIVRYEPRTRSYIEYVTTKATRLISTPLTETYACTKYKQEQYQKTMSKTVYTPHCQWYELSCHITSLATKVVTWGEWATRTIAYTATCTTTTYTQILQEYFTTTPITKTTTAIIPVYGWKEVQKTRIKHVSLPTGDTQCVQWGSTQVTPTSTPSPTATPTSTVTPTLTPTPTPLPHTPGYHTTMTLKPLDSYTDNPALAAIDLSEYLGTNSEVLDTTCVFIPSTGFMEPITNADTPCQKRLKVLWQTDPGGYDWHSRSLSRWTLSDPQDLSIPSVIQGIYGKTPYWNPQRYPEDYIECVSFVVMAYHMAGYTNLGRMGDARTWVTETGIFNVYKSGEARVMPKVGDAMVWAGPGQNHIGMITGVDTVNRMITVTSANVTTVTQTYGYQMVDNIVNLTNPYDLRPKTPTHWLSIK